MMNDVRSNVKEDIDQEIDELVRLLRSSASMS